MQESVFLISIHRGEIAELIKASIHEAVKPLCSQFEHTVKETIKNNKEPFRSAKWIAEKHGFCENTIRNWYKEGKIPGHKIGSSTTVFLESEFISSFRRVELKSRQTITKV